MTHEALFAALAASVATFSFLPQALAAQPQVGDRTVYSVTHRETQPQGAVVLMDLELTREVIAVDPSAKQMTLRVSQSGTAHYEGNAQTWPVSETHTEVQPIGCWPELLERNGSVGAACLGMGGQIDDVGCRFDREQTVGTQTIRTTAHYGDVPVEAMIDFDYRLTDSATGRQMTQFWKLTGQSRGR